ncbi:hypothetical protein BMR04_12675, partial [Methylococcaceae bacterium HT3]
MQAYLYSLLLVLITLQTAFAEEQNIQTDIQPKEYLSPGQPNNINNSVREEGIKHDLKYNGCNGFIRGGYIQTHTKTVSNQQAYGLG